MDAFGGNVTTVQSTRTTMPEAVGKEIPTLGRGASRRASMADDVTHVQSQTREGAATFVSTEVAGRVDGVEPFSETYRQQTHHYLENLLQGDARIDCAGLLRTSTAEDKSKLNDLARVMHGVENAIADEPDKQQSLRSVKEAFGKFVKESKARSGKGKAFCHSENSKYQALCKEVASLAKSIGAERITTHFRENSVNPALGKFVEAKIGKHNLSNPRDLMDKHAADASSRMVNHAVDMFGQARDPSVAVHELAHALTLEAKADQLLRNLKPGMPADASPAASEPQAADEPPVDRDQGDVDEQSQPPAPNNGGIVFSPVIHGAQASVSVDMTPFADAMRDVADAIRELKERRLPQQPSESGSTSADNRSASDDVRKGNSIHQAAVSPATVPPAPPHPEHTGGSPELAAAADEPTRTDSATGAWVRGEDGRRTVARENPTVRTTEGSSRLDPFSTRGGKSTVAPEMRFELPKSALGAKEDFSALGATLRSISQPIRPASQNVAIPAGTPSGGGERNVESTLLRRGSETNTSADEAEEAGLRRMTPLADRAEGPRASLNRSESVAQGNQTVRTAEGASRLDPFGTLGDKPAVAPEMRFELPKSALDAKEDFSALRAALRSTSQPVRTASQKVAISAGTPSGGGNRNVESALSRRRSEAVADALLELKEQRPPQQPSESGSTSADNRSASDDVRKRNPNPNPNPNPIHQAAVSPATVPPTPPHPEHTGGSPELAAAADEPTRTDSATGAWVRGEDGRWTVARENPTVRTTEGSKRRDPFSTRGDKSAIAPEMRLELPKSALGAKEDFSALRAALRSTSQPVRPASQKAVGPTHDSSGTRNIGSSTLRDGGETAGSASKVDATVAMPTTRSDDNEERSRNNVNADRREVPQVKQARGFDKVTPPQRLVTTEGFSRNS
ncbi:hypothetical protein [Burkholderia sp. ABCPW 14]|uniref:hypothetical protein n=1 Tax=Burkholderia sp. ABCPW 14 TaxID=1637860 RepID=UPI0012E3BA24|nr:hypothetical protein [Burkholderia sp. ABCPW 14]